MEQNSSGTLKFSAAKEQKTAREVLMTVYAAMQEKGYDPVNQIVGYLLSGDPTYITSHNNARYMIRLLERDELMEELVRSYIEQNEMDLQLYSPDETPQ